MVFSFEGEFVFEVGEDAGGGTLHRDIDILVVFFGLQHVGAVAGGGAGLLGEVAHTKQKGFAFLRAGISGAGEITEKSDGVEVGTEFIV